jgi:hypothetical protein
MAELVGQAEAVSVPLTSTRAVASVTLPYLSGFVE